MMTHDDDDSVIFSWAASSNISFTGTDESGYTWGDWRKMTDAQKDEAYAEFIFQGLGVEINVEEDES
jgi:hypothetical protein